MTLRTCLILIVASFLYATNALATDPNRLAYLDESDPFYVGLNFPKLTTPQWIGEPEVEAVVILAIDDMGTNHLHYENFLRPILQRLKKIDGHAPVSIFCNSINPEEPHLRKWLAEGVSLEVHTLTHPCPILAKDFGAASNTFHGGTALLNRVLGNKPVAFRTPCCDSINSASPRLFAELFNRANASNEFLTVDSSVMNILSGEDKSLPREWVTDTDGREKFRKYLPFPAFSTTIENYPYPYVIGKLCWEFPGAVPSDWEAQNLHGVTNRVTVADWKSALDATVLKRGTMNFIFHPHGWIRPDQIVEFIDYAVTKYGKKIKFLNFREAEERLRKNVLMGRPLRALNGQDNGVRLVDINDDGFLDVISANEQDGQTKIWNPKEKKWLSTFFPMALVAPDDRGERQETGVKFGIVRPEGRITALKIDEAVSRAWTFDGTNWFDDKSLLTGLMIEGKPVVTCRGNRQTGRSDNGVRFRDLDNDGRCELIVSNEKQNAIFSWSPEENTWKEIPYKLPEGVSLVNAAGGDNGLRFVDVNSDGFVDVIFSNAERYSLHLFVPEAFLGWSVGWTREVMSGKRGTSGEIPMIVRGGANPNNGAWFHSNQMWVQNEDTASMKNIVDHRSFDELLGTGMGEAKSPAESLAAIRVRPGFKVELVANEPLTMDPVAFDWGADGKLWVVEMADYPLGMDGKGKPGGRIRFLEDTNGDGRYDKSTLFLDGVNFPNGIIPWRKGVLVSAAPEIFYAEDTDGDGKCDLRKTLFRGFGEGNQQHRLNGFDYGLDNWIHGANGDSGGKIVSEKSGGQTDIGGRDFRFRPDDGLFESEEGQTQFGRHRDDWGNWFGNNNPNWLWHYIYPQKYLVRNPHLAVRDTKKYLADYPDSGRAYAISPSQQRMNAVGAEKHVTSANSPAPYRDELFGPDFSTSVFMSEPAQNLIHREVLVEDGVSFTSHRAPGEEQQEFLASSDGWFRPTQMKTGPDGALYFADMYRQTIEHPEWIPADVQKRVNLRAGEDRGRIYRVYPEGARLRKIPRLDQLSTVELVSALESPNGWQRDTAQRLLVHAQDKAAVAPLEKLIRTSANPKTRLQAICTLDGIGGVTPQIVAVGLRDSHPAVRANAIRVSEPLLGASILDGELEKTLLHLADDPEIRVRYQLAFSLGEWNSPLAARTLVKLALKDLKNSEVQTAVMSSAPKHIGEMLAGILAEKTPPANLVEQWLGLATALNDEKVFLNVLRQIALSGAGKRASWQLDALAGFLDALNRRGQTLAQFHQQADSDLKKTVEQMDGIFTEARGIADAKLDASKSPSEYLAAIRLLGRGLTQQDEDVTRLGRFLSPQLPEEIQNSALNSLKKLKGDIVAKVLLSRWQNLGPALRTETITTLFSRSEWIQALLKAIEENQIPAGQIGAAQQQKLLAHSDKTIQKRAAKLFVANADRQKVLKKYDGVAKSKGDAEKGHTLFAQTCAACHRVRGEGNSIGPDLGMVADKSIPVFLAAILDPNQAVEARYVSYSAVTKDDREVGGIMVTETPTSVTLRNVGGAEETILRADLKELKSSGLSLMPEGLEKSLSPQAMADLIAYLRSSPSSTK